MPEELARIVFNQVVKQILPYFGIAFISSIFANYFILKKLLYTKKPFAKGLMISILTLLVSIILMYEFKRQFIQQNKNDYQRILNK